MTVLGWLPRRVRRRVFLWVTDFAVRAILDSDPPEGAIRFDAGDRVHADWTLELKAHEIEHCTLLPMAYRPLLVFLAVGATATRAWFVFCEAAQHLLVPDAHRAGMLACIERFRCMVQEAECVALEPFAPRAGWGEP